MRRPRGLLLAAILCAAVGGWIQRASALQTNDELVQMVVTLLADEDKDVRAIGLDQVRTEAKGEAATREFAAQLPKLSPEAQVGLLSALADRGDSAAREAVLQTLASAKDETVQIAAIAATGALGQPVDAAALVSMLEDQSKSKQAAARAALVRLPGDAVPTTLAGIIKDDGVAAATRIALIEILTERRAPGTIPELLDVSIDADATVRAAAMVSLSQLAGPEHITAMIPGVLHATPGTEREAAEKAVAAVCGRGDDPATRAEPLIAAMNRLPPAEQMALLPAVGRIGGDAALQVVETAIGDAEPQRMQAGVRALCNWPDASVAPRLIELAKSAPKSELQAMALRALVRVAPLPDGRSDADKLALLKQTMSMCQRDEERRLVLRRAAAIRTPEALAFVLPYLDQPALAPQACEAVVELAHHRGLREPNKAQFDAALDRVLATANDPTVLDRATRYKAGQTWVKPKEAPR